MKNYLALDTSGGYLSVVARKGDRAYSVFVEDCAMKQSSLFMQKVDEALKKAELSLSECDFFASVVGAGSFTGIRIGISAIKGFALATGKPTLPITSFEVMAYTNIEDKGKILCLVDALHDYYYACGYEDGKMILSPCYIDKEQVLSLVEQGYALRATGALSLASEADIQIVNPEKGLQNAVEALSEKGAFGELTALYIRKSSAELNREEKV